jgi:hypothetical protein
METDREPSGSERSAAREQPQPGGGDDGEKHALVRHVQRVQSEHLARGEPGTRHGNGGLLELDADVGRRCDLVQRAGHSPPGRISKDAHVVAHRRAQRLDQRQETRRVARDLGLEGQSFPRGHDGHPMSSDGAAEQHQVAGAGPIGGWAELGLDEADTGGIDVEPIGPAALHHLCVPRNHLDPGPSRAPGHGLNDAVQHLVRQALLEDKTCREIPRAATHHGHIVEGAVDRERADVPARKLDRL